MASRLLQVFAVLTPLATCASAIAQQQPYAPPPPQPGYSQPPAGYQPPPPAQQPPPNYQPPPANYQPPAPAYPEQHAYPPPPVNYQAQPGYAPPQPAPYQAPPPAGYQPPPASYQSPPAGYPPQPSYPAQQGYPSQRQPGYESPSGYSQGAYAPAAGYQSPPAGYQPQQSPYPKSSSYPQSSPGYAPQSYPQQPQNYQTPMPAGYPSQQAPGYPSELMAASTQFSPYHTHLDVRYGHDRVYPDRGAIIRDAPRGALTIDYAGGSYRFSDGIWLEPRGPAFVVVSPPIGLVVPSLPRSATIVTSNGENYLYVNDTYYQSRPDLRGYEVVNDPLDTTPANPVLTPVPAAAGAATPAPEPSEAQVAPAPMATARATVPASLSVASAGNSSTSAASAYESPAAESSAVASLQVSPKNGQTLQEQARDRDECYRFAVLQSHFDPVHPDTTIPLAEIAQRRSGFQRAAGACFEGRGYAVR